MRPERIVDKGKVTMTARRCFAPALIALCVIATSAAGQDFLPLSVFPLTDRLQLAPGEGTSRTFAITNTSDAPVSLRVELLDFSFDEQGRIIELDPGSLGGRSLCPHIEYSPTHMSLQPGETSQVRYEVAIPADATGPHWAALVVAPENTAEVEEEAEGMAFRVELHSQYFFTIIQNPLDSPPAGQVAGMDVRGATAQDGTREITLAVTFQNLGESVLFNTVRYAIRDPQGDTIAQFEEPRPLTVFPSTPRIFAHTFTGLELPPGEYLILGIVDFGGDYLAAVQYLATVHE
jgi:hypothetical protein